MPLDGNARPHSREQTSSTHVIQALFVDRVTAPLQQHHLAPRIKHVLAANGAEGVHRLGQAFVRTAVLFFCDAEDRGEVGTLTATSTRGSSEHVQVCT